MELYIHEGGYYIRMGYLPQHKGTTVFKSPLLQLTTPHVVSFFYYMYIICPTSSCGINTLTLSYELEDGSLKNVWTIRNLNVYTYLPARAPLPVGTKRLVFTMISESGSAGIDDITISNDMSLIESEFYKYCSKKLKIV